MRSVALVLAGVVWAAAGVAFAQPSGPKPTVITRPDWIVPPNGDDLAERYPALAGMVGIPGRVMLHCRVALDGSLDCTVVEETPAGLGFGDAALGFSKGFKMKPMTVDGRPVAGGEINVPIRFDPEQGEDEGASPEVEAAVAALAPGAAGGAGPSARSADLARKIAAATLGRTDIKPFKDLAREAMTKEFGGAKLTAAQKAAIDDYVEALGVTMDARVAATADGYAQLFSEKELSDIDGFFESASGQAWLSRSPRYAAKVSANLETEVQADARKRFCAQFNCPAPSTTPAAAAAK